VKILEDKQSSLVEQLNEMKKINADNLVDKETIIQLEEEKHNYIKEVDKLEKEIKKLNDTSNLINTEKENNCSQIENLKKELDNLKQIQLLPQQQPQQQTQTRSNSDKDSKNISPIVKLINSRHPSSKIDLENHDGENISNYLTNEEDIKEQIRDIYSKSKNKESLANYFIDVVLKQKDHKENNKEVSPDIKTVAGSENFDYEQKILIKENYIINQNKLNKECEFEIIGECPNYKHGEFNNKLEEELKEQIKDLRSKNKYYLANALNEILLKEKNVIENYSLHHKNNSELDSIDNDKRFLLKDKIITINNESSQSNKNQVPPCSYQKELLEFEIIGNDRKDKFNFQSTHIKTYSGIETTSLVDYDKKLSNGEYRILNSLNNLNTLNTLNQVRTQQECEIEIIGDKGCNFRQLEANCKCIIY